ncbi:hypothetical protein RFI_12290 [Reticulomyxa filosa]|uniref:Uncharacterized protein n=1 Tax=Reticulomyxa filosa TaxID=46433 RepID=X6NHS1_RETFI|nr:hypothetical protein RFI_12290 [Reticulomyxa filosa]|eukprot:ETO24867.1 hypothetical protein RFI_12290 [Reticulomyxa filosa]
MQLKPENITKIGDIQTKLHEYLQKKHHANGDEQWQWTWKQMEELVASDDFVKNDCYVEIYNLVHDRDRPKGSKPIALSVILSQIEKEQANALVQVAQPRARASISHFHRSAPSLTLTIPVGMPSIPKPHVVTNASSIDVTTLDPNDMDSKLHRQSIISSVLKQRSYRKQRNPKTLLSNRILSQINNRKNATTAQKDTTTATTTTATTTKTTANTGTSRTQVAGFNAEKKKTRQKRKLKHASRHSHADYNESENSSMDEFFVVDDSQDNWHQSKRLRRSERLTHLSLAKEKSNDYLVAYEFDFEIASDWSLFMASKIFNVFLTPSQSQSQLQQDADLAVVTDFCKDVLVGLHCDIRDEWNDWFEGIIEQVKITKKGDGSDDVHYTCANALANYKIRLRVHFKNFSHFWDQWITLPSENIAPLRKYSHSFIVPDETKPLNEMIREFDFNQIISIDVISQTLNLNRIELQSWLNNEFELSDEQIDKLFNWAKKYLAQLEACSNPKTKYFKVLRNVFVCSSSEPKNTFICETILPKTIPVNLMGLNNDYYQKFVRFVLDQKSYFLKKKKGKFL